LTTGPAGSYTYGNSTFRDAVTSTNGGYSAAYDGAGDMTCRAPTSSQTCSGTQTGQQVGYDQLRRILNWKNGVHFTSSADYAYDGEGNRVIQNSTSTSQRITYYVGTYEESTSDNETTITKYYAAGAATATVAVGHTLANNEYTKLADYDNRVNMPILEWCEAYGSKVCTKPPTD